MTFSPMLQVDDSDEAEGSGYVMNLQYTHPVPAYTLGASN